VKLIVGLGNPGNEYAQTRHNAGFMVLDRLAVRHGLSNPKSKFHSGVLDGQIAGQRCLLLQPMTYMNRSGLAVGEAAGFYKLDPADDLLVVVDDVALPAGQVRLRAEGGTGGHNGLADIERVLSTRTYPRLRIGVDPPGRVPQADYVLGRFSPDQWALVEPALDRACDTVECWLAQGIDLAMTRYNTGPQDDTKS
jgi:PTH1 family peptidyl-tRNA hydrolase